ncbi:unnamed protein product [Calypogeia fissa]
MSPRRLELWRRYILSIGQRLLPCPPTHSHLARALSLFLPFVSHATEALGSHQFSSISNPQDAGLSETRWHELPPVPKQGRRWTARELNEENMKERKGSEVRDGECDRGYEGKQITALQWVTKCCPSLPSSLLHKLFRVRQVRQRSPLPEPKHVGQSFDMPAIEQLATRMRRVSVKAVLEEGTVLYLPKSLFHNGADKVPRHSLKKTEHQPTAAEFEWLQSLVLYKDAEILVINKPPGLPVQGGSQIKKSLDSLMGSALCFDYDDGPRLVHRLDKETSGLMILARTQECAMLLHTLFREKTATAAETEDSNTTIKRVYWALVIGTPRKLLGRISVPLIKVVLDEGKSDKIMVTHNFSSENAQVAITDYKVIGPSYHGCTWLELHPVTGRKHQLRVHCAEVLGTPVLGDMKYGWRTQKEYLRKMSSQNSETFSSRGAAETIEGKYSEAVRRMKAVKGSLLNKEPLLHLHCLEIFVPNVLQMLDKDRGRLSYVDVDRLHFVASLPPHMAASRRIWDENTSATSD